MTVDLSALNLADDLRDIEGSEEAGRWRLELPEPLEVWVSMVSAGAPGETFQARLAWTTYPTAPPSLKFRDPATGRLDLATAWPVVRGFRPATLDACVNWCTEGLALHPEWRTDPRYAWDPRGNALLKILRILQNELDEHFQGRAR